MTRQKSKRNTGIERFWKWFQQVADDLGKNLENDTILQELDRRVSELGNVAWEVGPGKIEPSALVITPDGAVGEIEKCRRIVALAPTIEGWEFHSARPPRQWDLRFMIERDAGGFMNIDARGWRYVLFRFPDHTFDIVLEAHNLDKATSQERYRAAVVLLDGILGEIRRLKRIKGIDIVISLTQEQETSASAIEVLGEHLESLSGV